MKNVNVLVTALFLTRLLAGASSANLTTAAASAETAGKASPDLIGHIQSKDGQPIAKAGVFIYTAGPRVGTSPI